MNIKARINVIIRVCSLIIAILASNPVESQQSIQPPLINLVSPDQADSLNNTGVTTVTAEIVSAAPLLSFRIINNSGTVVNENGTKPEKKDDKTYVVRSFVPLRKGLNTISVEARNAGGTTFSETRTVNSHLEPFITWITPARNNINYESGILTILVELKTLYPIQDLTVNINGSESMKETAGILPAGENTFHFEKRIQLRPGRNTIYLSANNSKGITKSVSRIIYFGTPPVIELKSPLAEDSINNTGIVSVIAEIGSASPLQTYRMFLNGVIILDEKSLTPEKKDSTTWIIGSNLPLKKGINIVYAEAKNALGTATSEKRIVNSHNEPFVVWLTPGTDNFTAKSPTFKINAEIKTTFPLQSLRTNVNGSLSGDDRTGLSQPAGDTYLFEKVIQLKPGKNSLFISAGNTKGITRSATRIINFGSAPQITVLSPSSPDSLNNSGVVQVRAEIVSYVPLLTFRIVINEETAVSETAMKPEKKDSVTYVIGSTVPLRKGENTIYVEAKNALGTASSGRKIIQSQSEPFITWLSPVSLNSEAETGDVKLSAEIRSFLDLQTVRLTLNGNVVSPEEGEITKTGDGIYLFQRSIQDVMVSKNTVILTASNIRGTATSESRVINYSSGLKPVVVITSPDTLNNSGVVVFSAEIVSLTKLQTIRIVQNGTVLAYESSKIPEQKDSVTYVYKSLIPLKAGQNLFYVEAKNSFGTGTSARRTIVCKPEPIINWISPSFASSADSAGTFKVKAEIITSIDLLSSGINLNGVPLAEQKEAISRVANDRYILEKVIPLNEGENTIILSAGNARGTGYSQKRTIRYEKAFVAESKISVPEATKPEIVQRVKEETENVPETKIEIKEPVIMPAAQTEAPVAITEKPEETLQQPASKPMAPVMTWLSPSRESTDINMSSARIRVSVKSSEKPQSLLVYVNGVASEDINLLSSPGPQGEYTIEKSISLRPGENNIYMIATNDGGTTRSDTRFLTNPPANPPVVSWAVPAVPNSIVNSEIVLVEACIKSATELKEVKVLVNGVQQASEMMFPTPMTGDCNYRIAKSLVLKDGDNSIYIIADNYAGSITSERRVIRFQTGTAEKRLALVIGNSNYGTSAVLKNPVNDANLIEGTLKSLGFEVIKRLDATKDIMMGAVRDFSKKLTDYNVALFYYAGHGVQVDGENYLIPVDASLDEQGDCKFDAISVNFIVEEFEKVPENINIVILDACRNNPFRSWARGGSEGFRALNAVTGTIVGYATSENSTAADGSRANGTYTEELVKQMVIPQSISSVFINTRKQVLARTNNNQRPQEWNMLTGDFYFKK